MSSSNDADAGDPIQCPKCNAPMERLTVAEIELDRCRSCGGLWLDMLEKDKLIAAHAAHLADARPPAHPESLDEMTRIKCPRDHAMMIHVVDPAQPHIGFESCTVCGGAFLDAGELTDLSELTLLERIRSFLA